jgi:hypothetical protein
LDETENVTTLTAPETVVKTHLGPHVEAGASLFVERAEALERTGAGLFQSDILPHHVGNVDALAQLINVTSTYTTGHDASVVSGERKFPRL